MTANKQGWVYKSRLIPNTTQTPNLYIDRAMSLLTGPEFKTLAYAVRRILGFHLETANIGISQFMQGNGILGDDGQPVEYGTGLGKSAQMEACSALVGFGFLIEVTPSSGRRPTEYALQLDDSLIRWDLLEDRAQAEAGRNREKTQKARNSGQDGPAPMPVAAKATEAKIEAIEAQPAAALAPLADVAEIWGKAQELLQMQVTRAAYVTHILPLKAVGNGDAITLIAPSMATADWVANRLVNIVTDALEDASGRACQWAMVVKNDPDLVVCGTDHNLWSVGQTTNNLWSVGQTAQWSVGQTTIESIETKRKDIDLNPDPDFSDFLGGQAREFKMACLATFNGSAPRASAVWHLSGVFAAAANSRPRADVETLQANWWKPLEAVAEAAAWDLPLAAKAIDQTLARMKKAPQTPYTMAQAAANMAARWVLTQPVAQRNGQGQY